MLTYTCDNCGKDFEAKIAINGMQIKYKERWVDLRQIYPCPYCYKIGEEAKEKALKKIRKV